MKTEIVDLLSDDETEEVEFVGSAQPTKRQSNSSSQQKKPAAKSNTKKAASHAKPNVFAAMMNNQNNHNHHADPYGPLADGEETLVQGSAKQPYKIKRVDCTYVCSCPAWKMQKIPPAQGRTCKHINSLRAGYPANHIGHAVVSRASNSSSSSNAKKRKGSTTAASKASSKKSAATAAAKSSNTGNKTTANPSAAAAATTKSNEPFQVTLAEKWDPKKHGDPRGWFLSEKLDGQRCYWDGRGTLWSRNGNAVSAPDAFLQQLPRGTALDGELFLGRGQFQDLQSIVKSGRTHGGWGSVRYAIFDAAVAGDFHQRSRAARSALERAQTPADTAYWLPHSVCRSVEHVRQELETVTSQGGEGVMLRDPAAPYHHGRTSSLLKVKKMHDAEAVVVAHEPGKGQNAGLLGALRCRMLNENDNDEHNTNKPNKIFKIGTGFSRADRANPPPVGATVTYRYQELTSKAGLPRFPVFVRVHSVDL